MLALKNLDLDRRLLGRQRRVDLGARGWDGGVACDDHAVAVGDDLAKRKLGHRDAQRVRRHVDQDGVDRLAGDDCGLHRRAERHRFVGVDGHDRRDAGVLAKQPLHQRDARAAAH